MCEIPEQQWERGKAAEGNEISPDVLGEPGGGHLRSLPGRLARLSRKAAKTRRCQEKGCI